MSARPIGRTLFPATPPAARRPGEPKRPAASIASQAIPALTVTGRPAVNRTESDPFIRALARYIEALHRRYPEGPAQMRREALDRRANMPRMSNPRKGSAA